MNREQIIHALKQADALLERLYLKCKQTGVLDKAEALKMFDHRARMSRLGEVKEVRDGN